MPIIVIKLMHYNLLTVIIATLQVPRGDIWRSGRHGGEDVADWSDGVQLYPGQRRPRPPCTQRRPRPRQLNLTVVHDRNYSGISVT